MFKRCFYILLYLLSPIIPVFLLFLEYQNKSNITHEIASMLGAVAYCWIAGQLVMASRPKFIIQYFWDDEYYHFHKIMGVIILAVGVLHGLLEIKLGLIFLLISKIGYVTTALFTFFIIIACIFMVDEEKIMKLNLINKVRTKLVKHIIFNEKNLIRIHSMLAIVAMILLYHVLISKANYMLKVTYATYFLVSVILYLVFKMKKVIAKFGKKV
jgi:hypothetical protein